MSPCKCIFRFVVVGVVILLSYICVVRLFFVYFALVLLLFMCQFLHSFNIWRRRGENVWRPASIIHSECQPPFHSLSRCLLTLSVRTLSATESFPGERYFVVRTREKDYPPTRTPKYNETTASPNTGEIIVLPPPNPHPRPHSPLELLRRDSPFPYRWHERDPPSPRLPIPPPPPPSLITSPRPLSTWHH